MPLKDALRSYSDLLLRLQTFFRVWARIKPVIPDYALVKFKDYCRGIPELTCSDNEYMKTFLGNVHSRFATHFEDL